MYERDDMVRFVKMLEGGLFVGGDGGGGKGFVDTKVFALEDWEAAFDEAAVWTGIGRAVVIAP